MKTGNTGQGPALPAVLAWPQWSPAMKTGNTSPHGGSCGAGSSASMEPGHEDREYSRTQRSWLDLGTASMEPGHEDREYRRTTEPSRTPGWPQWSPAMKTGNTR